MRSYAIEVGLNPDEAIRDFIAQFPNETGTGRLQPRQAEESEHAGSAAGPSGNLGHAGDAGNPGDNPEAVSNLGIAPAFLAVTLSVLVGGCGALFQHVGPPRGRAGGRFGDRLRGQ